MSYYIVNQSTLKGKIEVSGAKNAAVSIIAASVLADGEVVLENVPLVEDVKTQFEILKFLGARVKYINKNTVSIDSTTICNHEIPCALSQKSRASILFISSVLARFRKVKIGLPGGDAIGPRPLDLHFKGFRALGSQVSQKRDYFEINYERLRGTRVFLDRPSTTGTENLMILATMIEGTTIIENAERMPEIVDLAKFLRSMGAKITGERTGVITIRGVKKLQPVSHKIIPDPLEAGTYLVAAAITKGDVVIENAEPQHMIPTIAKLREAGATIKKVKNGLRVTASTLNSINICASVPYPNFQSDMQPIFAAALTTAKGTSTICDLVFPNRFCYTHQLSKMGGNIRIEDNTAIIKGVSSLKGNIVEAQDIRGGASLVVAALAAQGETKITNVFQIERGYENITKKLSQLGADIRRV